MEILSKDATPKRKGDFTMKQEANVKRLVMIGLLGALSGVLMLFKFPLPFMPPFMEFDLSGITEVIGGFVLGPRAAVLIILVKLLVKLALMGSTTMLTGEASNFLLSCTYAVSAAWIYHHHKSKRSGEIGMAVGTILCCLAAVATNLFLIFPFYVNLMGLSMEEIIAMCGAVNPLMKNTLTLVLFGIIPFNLFKCTVTSVITVLVYKRVSKTIKHYIH